MPRGRPRKVVEEEVVAKPKHPKAAVMHISVKVDAPWGNSVFGFKMKNPAGQIARARQNRKSLQRAVLEGLRAELGGSFEPD